MRSSILMPACTTSRFDPYRRDVTRITDLCDMLSAATASTLNEGTAMEDDGENAAQHHASAMEGEDSDGDSDVSGVETRGKILQRHKREWKSLRSKLNDMKAHKKAMGHGTLAKKDAKKDVSKEIKALEETMRLRHEQELASFDAQNGDSVPTEAYCEHNRQRSMCKACRKTSLKILPGVKKNFVSQPGFRG